MLSAEEKVAEEPGSFEIKLVVLPLPITQMIVHTGARTHAHTLM